MQPMDQVTAPEQHIWIRALAVEREHATRTAVFVAERIGAPQGNTAGVEKWKAIAARVAPAFLRDSAAKLSNGTVHPRKVIQERTGMARIPLVNLVWRSNIA